MRNLEGLNSPKSILVVGGGISGVTAAVEAAEVGYDVLLVEKEAYLGGRVARMHQYFPKLCAPYCGLEINFRRIKNNPKVRVLNLAEVKSIDGKEGAYDVVLKLSPEMVNDNCTACGKCAEACPVERPNDFNYGLDKTKAAYLPHLLAFPAKYAIDAGACKGADCGKCAAACQYGAIDLKETAKEVTIRVGAVVMTTGWKPYDAARLENLGYGRYANVITNVIMERLASDDGPTHGRIVRPSDGKPVNSIAFVQCAGSRDKNHLPYCSGVCCLGSLKQVTYVKEKNPDARVFVFYIDVRAPGTLEDFYRRVQGYKDLSLVKGKVARVREDPQTKDPIVEVEDVLQGKKLNQQVDMVVLATGIVSNASGAGIAAPLTFDDNGFIASAQAGIYAAGCSRRPADVSTSVTDATGAALKAIQSIVRRASGG